jgi:hypothetical protein
MMTTTNYQDHNIDFYKEELWKIVKETLMLQGYDIRKLEEQIFGEESEDDMYALSAL